MTGIDRPDVFRQSLLQGFMVCARRTKHAMLAGDSQTLGWVGHAGDLGTAFHAFAAEYLRTLYRQGEPQMATQEAVEVLYEVLRGLPFSLPFEALDDLRWMVLGFCNFKWRPERILAIEETLFAEVECPDREIRVLKGQPDLLMADPPDGLVVCDWKSGRGRPKGPRQEPEAGEVVEGREYLSSTYQGDVYSLLGLRRYPAAKRVVFRELHVRSGQIRQATMGREALEHVERKLATTMMLLDRAISEGEDSPLWAPRPGAHCVWQCPVAVSCPVPREMRGDGALDTPERADAAARAWAVLEGVREALRSQLKAVVEDPGNPLPRANDREVVAWRPPTGTGRRFGLWNRADVEMEGSDG